MALARDIQIGQTFLIEGDHDRRVFIRIAGGTETTRGRFIAARRDDGLPGFYPETLSVIPQ